MNKENAVTRAVWDSCFQHRLQSKVTVHKTQDFLIITDIYGNFCLKNNLNH